MFTDTEAMVFTDTKTKKTHAGVDMTPTGITKNDIWDMLKQG